MSDAVQNLTPAEGSDVAAALQKAAEILGVPVSAIEYKLDLSHFRNQTGRPRAVDTVRILCWTKDPELVSIGGVAEAWVTELLGHMGLKGTVRASVKRDGEGLAVAIAVDSPDARFLVGRQGATLGAIQELLEVALGRKVPNATFRLDIAGGARDREERRDRDDRGDRGDRRGRDDRGERRGRDDRGDRRGRDDRGDRRGRDDRGDRGDRGDRRGRDRDDSGKRSERELEELRRLAVRLANQAAETGEAIEIRRELNSYERRVVHMAVGDVAGVRTESVGEGPTRRIRILPAGDGDVAGDED